MRFQTISIFAYAAVAAAQSYITVENTSSSTAVAYVTMTGDAPADAAEPSGATHYMTNYATGSPVYAEDPVPTSSEAPVEPSSSSVEVVPTNEPAVSSSVDEAPAPIATTLSSSVVYVAPVTTASASASIIPASTNNGTASGTPSSTHQVPSQFPEEGAAPRFGASAALIAGALAVALAM